MKRAFTLIELLMAMLILAVGLVAIATLFPVSGVLQRSAANEIRARDHRGAIEAMITAQPLIGSTISGNSPHVRRLPEGATSDPSLPSGVAWPILGEQYHWLPLIQRSGESWRVFYFILDKADSSVEDVPCAVAGKVFTFAHGGAVEEGSLFLASTGVIYEAVAVDGDDVTVSAPVTGNPTRAWFSRGALFIGVRGDAAR
jgi:prepilin-type N-terminal cleavage/methylation domain-containing protein